VVALAALLYLVVGWGHGVGLINDDAEYIMAAKALAEGSGSINRLPGLPFLLMPLAPWSQPPFTLLKLFPWALTLISCVLVWRLSEPLLQPRPRVALLILYAFNPLVAEYAGRVMTEPLFTAVVLASFLLVRGLLRKESAPRAWLLGLLLGWAAIIRGEGFILLASTALALWLGNRKRALAQAVGLAGIISLSAYLGQAGYLRIWSSSAPSLRPDYWIGHGLFLLRIFTWNTLMGASRFPTSAMTTVFATLLLLSAAWLFIRGLRRLEKQDRSERLLLLCAYCFFFLYSLLHLLWPVSDPRFFLVLLPFALLAIVEGARDAGSPLVLAGLGLWLFSYANGNVQSFRETDAAPKATFSWIRANTLSSARFWSYDSALIELYTNRRAVRLTVPADEEAFRDRLLSERIDFLYYAPMRIAFEAIPGIERLALNWSRSRQWVASSAAYRPVYASPEESTLVYRVVPSESFQRAYALYRSALEEFSRAEWEQGLPLIEEALRLEPRFASALNAYGATCLITGRDLALAEKRLLEAVRLRPDYAVAQENLLRVRERLGRGS